MKISKKSKERLTKIAELTAIPSPTGNTSQIIQFLAGHWDKVGVRYGHTATGGVRGCG